MKKLVPFLWTAYRAYQGDPKAAVETLKTMNEVAVKVATDVRRPS